MKVYRGLNPYALFEERVLDGAASPGQAVVRSGGKFAATSVESTLHAILTDKANVLAGNELGAAYADGDNVEAYVPQNGEKIEMILAAGMTVSKDDALFVNSDGYLEKVADGETQFAIADEDAKTTTAVGTIKATVSIL